MKINSKNQILSILAIILFFPLAGQSQTTSVEKSKYFSNKEIEDEIGYAQVVRVGNTLYISGVPGKGTMPEAIKSVYERIEKVLIANGAGFQNVVKETVYAVDLQEFIKNQNLRKPYFKGDYPASTWVEVRGLYLPEFKLEVEMIAELK
jgi:enamine deaminase RidA (YjgF/YER057c/UK114 family)